ncbi:hypothetical protein LCGC14_0423350 [marine sediment metagenome]|uniref:Uncharacterized protein n=1 Tax=marine sediment metagenome TaxID=412755 RepID=A0A0F9T872_9ZZZZ
MAESSRDWHIKIKSNDTPAEERRFRLLKTKDGGLQWQRREEAITPRIQTDAASISFESSPAERGLAFAQSNWEWGDGMHIFTGNEPGMSQRIEAGVNCDTSVSRRIRHGPELIAVGAGTINRHGLQHIYYEDKVYLLTSTELYSWDDTTLATENAAGAGSFKQCVEYEGVLYIARGGATTYSTWNGTTLEAGATPNGSPADPGGANKKIIFFAKQGNRLWAAYDDNTISFISAVGASAWEEAISVGSGKPITNLFVVSGLLFIATEEDIFVLDSAFVPHEIDQNWRSAPSSNNFKHAATTGGQAWLANAYFPDLFRLVASGFEEFNILPSSPRFSSRRRPVNFKDLINLRQLFGIDTTFDAVYVHMEVTALAPTGGLPKGHYVLKGVDKGGSEIAWTTLAQFSAPTDTVGESLGVLRLPGEGAAFAYMTVEASSVFTWRRVPVEDWPATSDSADYATSWSVFTPYFDAGLPTWDKVWWRLRTIVEKVGAGSTATLQILAREDGVNVFTSIGTVASGEDGVKTFAVPETFVGKKIQLAFTGTVGNSNLDGVDLLSFSLEGILKPENVPLYDFTVVTTNRGEADFLKDLRSNSEAITLTDRFDSAKSVFVIPGFPVELELFDDILKQPVRAYHFLMQEKPPTS